MRSPMLAVTGEASEECRCRLRKDCRVLRMCSDAGDALRVICSLSASHTASSVYLRVTRARRASASAVYGSPGNSVASMPKPCSTSSAA